jgi:hypothetical protein
MSGGGSERGRRGPSVVSSVARPPVSSAKDGTLGSSMRSPKIADQFATSFRVASETGAAETITNAARNARSVAARNGTRPWRWEDFLVHACEHGIYRRIDLVIEEEEQDVVDLDVALQEEIRRQQQAAWLGDRNGRALAVQHVLFQLSGGCRIYEVHHFA